MNYHAPFSSAEAAWFWAVRALQTGAGRGYGPDRDHRQQVEDIVKCLDTLYRQRRIELLHARILQIWGARGIAPNPGRPRERSDWRIWHEAVDRLEGPLRSRGIVARSFLQDAAD